MERQDVGSARPFHGLKMEIARAFFDAVGM